jgi:hypothetical protein
MNAKSKRRRRPRGSAWHWKQTDCWYYTPPGTTQRVPLVDEAGRRVRGEENRKAAELALARLKLAGQWRPTAEPGGKGEWVVAQVCSEYIQSCERRVARGAVSQGYCHEVSRYLNELCSYCGALPVGQLRRGHVKHWIEIHETWRSPATQRNAIAILLAAFNHAQETPLYRNSQARPWKKGTGVGRFRRLKEKLSWDKDPRKKKYSCYTCRHTFAHRMLSGYWNGGVGCSIETLAELMGDTPKVAFDHYGKQWGQHYQEPLWMAIGAGPKSSPEAPA